MGQFDADIHSRSYSIITEAMRQDYKDVHDKLVIAKRAERSCPPGERDMRMAERQALDVQADRLRTRLDAVDKVDRERAVLSQAKRQEREQQRGGKGAWFMKDCERMRESSADNTAEKRDLLLKSRFDALEAEGGQAAVKKAISKRRVRQAQQEKRTRPSDRRMHT